MSTVIPPRELERTLAALDGFGMDELKVFVATARSAVSYTLRSTDRESFLAFSASATCSHHPQSPFDDAAPVRPPS